jgi:HK97 family phage major capsid protein
MKTARELKDERKALHVRQVAMLEKAETEKRALTPEEDVEMSGIEDQIKALEVQIERYSAIEQRAASFNEVESRRNSAPPQGFNFNKNTGIGDNALKATAAYVKRGDRSGLAALDNAQLTDFMAASNDTDMNVTTAEDGGVLVPTAHFQGIVAKRNESALFGPLGVTPFNGYRGTTLNVPAETGSANVFVSTAESPGTVDRDAPVLGTAALTYVNFTKSIELTNDLRDMEDSQLMVFLTNYVGRALALTHNSALVTEALAGGTTVALGAAAAATAGDVETLEYAVAAEYADGAFFVMRRATLGAYRKLTGNPFLYQATPAGMAPRALGESQAFLSSFVPAIGAGNKSSIFGNFEYMGMREIPLTFLYDPYSKANTSRVMLHYRTSIVYKTLNADAIYYGTHPTA